MSAKMAGSLGDDGDPVPGDWNERLVPAVFRSGTPGPDRLVGTAGADELRGGRGPDVLEGRAGPDLLVGARGADSLSGGRGGDVLRGGIGPDRLFGNRGEDTLLGGRGGDLLRGGARDDVLRGRLGDDVLFGGRDGDVLRGGPGSDAVDGGRGPDILLGGAGADLFRLAHRDARDDILDFSQMEGDQLDLAAHLDGFGPGDRIENFVELRVEAGGTVVAVDPRGGQDFTDVALLAGVDAIPGRVTDPIPGRITPGDVRVELVDLLQAPASEGRGQARARLNQLSEIDDGSGRLLLLDSRGPIHVIEDGLLQPEPFLNVRDVYDGDFVDGSEAGLRSFALHPDFDQAGAPGFGKVYTALEVSAASAAASPDAPVFTTPGSASHHDLIVEWTLDPADPDRVDPASAREVLRVEQLFLNHNIGQIGFDPGAAPGDPDYGLLFAGIGDGGGAGDPRDQARDLASPLGKILRIDPLASGDASYTVPDDNPFVDAAGALPEIWAQGLRHPQFLSWDPGGDGKMLIGDIGQANIEEVNLGIAGADYGWSAREGTFALDPDDVTRVLELPPFDASFDVTYPVAQYDHDEGNAIAGGFVYRGDAVPELFGQYVFGDIVNGRIFLVDADALELGRQAPIEELTLLRDGEPISILDLVDAPRADLRFGQDLDGELYVTTKQDGMVRTFAPAPAADDLGALLPAEALGPAAG